MTALNYYYYTGQRWETAEAHFRRMAEKYVVPTIVIAQEMAARPWFSAARVADILRVLRQLEGVRRIYTSPLVRCRETEEALAEADQCFRQAVKSLEEWDG